MHRSGLIGILSLLVLIGCGPHTEVSTNRSATDHASAASQGSESNTSAAAQATQTSTPSPTPTEQVAVQTASNSAVQLSVSVEPGTCKPGQSVQCVAKFKIGSGWHIYAMKGGAGPSQPTRLKLELPSWLKEEGDWIAPEAQMNLSHFGPEMIYTDEITISRKLILGSDAPIGSHHVPCSISVQACNASRCLPPETFSLSLPMTISSE